MVVAQDFTYSKGYLALLSTLGASLGIIFCCVPYSRGILGHLREVYHKRTSVAVQIDKERAATDLENPKIISHPRIDIRATQTHDKSARWSLGSCVDGTERPLYGGVKCHYTL